MELVNMIKLGAMGFKPADIKEMNAKGVNSDQIIELSKAGYKVEDVNELIKLAQKEPAAAPEEKEPESKPDTPSGNPEEQKQLDDTRKALEEAQKQLEEQKAIVSKLQNKNASKDLGKPDQPTHEENFRKALMEIY